MKLCKLLILAMALTFLSSFALAEMVNKDLDPTFYGETGLFTIFSSDSLPQGMFTFGLIYHNYDRETLDFDTNIFNFVLGYGITDNLEIAASFAPITQVTFVNYGNGEVLNTHPHAIRTIENGMGDARVGLKYRLLDDGTGPFGLAVRVFAKLPLAEYEGGFGSGEFDFGGTLILSKNFSEQFEAAANLGYTIMGQPDDLAGDLSNELNYGLGIGWTIDPGLKIKFLGEVKGIVYANDDDYPQAAPLDIFVGLQKRFKIAPKYDFRLGFGYQINAAFDTDVAENPHGAGLMLTVGPSKNIPPVIKELKAERNANCINTPLNINVIAFDENGDDLIYTWKVNNENISDTGSSITWTPTNPRDYTLTVTVDDGRKGIVSENIAIKAYPPPTVKLSINSDVVYATKKYTVTAAVTNPGDYPLTYSWNVDRGTIAPMTNQAEATWDLTNATEGAAVVTLIVKNEIGCEVTEKMNVDVQKDPCLTITDEDVAGEVYFPLNKYELREPTEEAYKIFDRVIEKMKLCDSMFILFEGHCCILGTEQYNMCLGWWRTETVVKYFVEHGISRDQIKTISYGKTKPKYDNSKEKTRQWNRRVEIKKDTGLEVPVGPEKDQFIEKCKKRYSRWLK